MSIETCDRHGRYDTDFHHGCPRCDSEELWEYIKRNCPSRADEIDTLRAQAAGLAADAARYRWLRDKTAWLGFQWHTGKSGIDSIENFSTSNHHPARNLDNKVDAAREQGAEGGKV